MNVRLYWQFYKAIFPFAMAFGMVALAIWGVFLGYLLFCTLGFGFGILGFQTFRKNEYYSYYNLGHTKWNLFKIAFAINFIVGAPIFLLFLTLFLLFFGQTSFT
ncbi:hypothetical protein G5B37_00860 [Rasiella rasia]|uniref:Uncharacterized protein n=1 Tax=Rasiella rasia TaxID=2744027 RepID=A0A6G6GHY9_9FLAO|nr:hypothetical protein [Rasiella rasia]QIE58162.1 hypothetical protein G5B37_00860 [Rasiella rasia]